MAHPGARSSARQLLSGAILTALVLFGAGCSRRTADIQKAGETSRLPNVLSYEGATVGKGDSLINAIGPKLRPWVVLWRHAVPFAPESLIRVGVGAAFRNG